MKKTRQSVLIVESKGYEKVYLFLFSLIILILLGFIYKDNLLLKKTNPPIDTTTKETALPPKKEDKVDYVWGV